MKKLLHLSLKVVNSSMTKRITKRKALIYGRLENGHQKGAELYRKVRCFLQQQEANVDTSFVPEYYIRSFNRTVNDNFIIQSKGSFELPSYFLFLDIYYELIESRVISSNFPKSRLMFLLMRNSCVVVAKVWDDSYCQIARKSITRNVYFIAKDRHISVQEFEDWSTKEPLGIKAFYISSSGQKTPILQNQTVRLTSVSKVFLESEDLFISLGNTNFVGFS